MNGSAGDERGVRYTENNDTPHFNRISDEEKDCSVVGTAHAVSRTKTPSYGTVSETFDSLQKGRNCVFATNNQNQGNLGVAARFVELISSYSWFCENNCTYPCGE